jgi:aspartyl-tRNA(Asn)/glutamyl-tRNA(Gln) amidotransferase subunit C
MAIITKKDVEKIARLARIEVLESKKELLAQQLSATLNWVETLNEVNTDKVEPLSNLHHIAMVMAPDIVSDGDITEEVLKNAPNAKYNYFTVPKVIE